MQHTILTHLPASYIADMFIESVRYWQMSAGFSDRDATDVVAKHLGKSPRTVEPWSSRSGWRTIQADDLLKIYIAAIWSKVKSETRLGQYWVHDAQYEPVCCTESLSAASFLADSIGGHLQGVKGNTLELPRDIKNRSRLRNVLKTRLVSMEEAAEVFGVCEYRLIYMIVDGPFEHRAITPTNVGLRKLEKIVADRMEKAGMEVAA